jgi:hypothetical protein
MKPILLIHGYSSEGSNNTVQKIYGTLPADLRREFGRGVIRDLNLSRWLSINDGVRLDDVSYAMDRALHSSEFSALLKSGFHVIIHSTGALVVRNWIKKFSPKPSPIENVVHLAGANFGSGLAHIGKAQLVRWGRYLGTGTEGGQHILDELEFGNWKTLDLHSYFLEPGNAMVDAYEIQEYCIAGSQTLTVLRAAPIRYVKEDSSDNTVRTSAVNLNYTRVRISPSDDARRLSVRELKRLVKARQQDESVNDKNYIVTVDSNQTPVPFAVAYETAHYGGKKGIVAGTGNRSNILPKIKQALSTPLNSEAYERTRKYFDRQQKSTFRRVANLKGSLFEWSKQAQYEGHAQVVFRLRDQYGIGIRNFDITFKTRDRSQSKTQIESLIEDDHLNKSADGTITFYLRTQKFKNKKFYERLDKVAATTLEIFATESNGAEIEYLPVTLLLNAALLKQVVRSFQTTIVEVEMLRLPTGKVFSITRV